MKTKKPFATVYKDGFIPRTPWMIKTNRGIWPVAYTTQRRALEVAGLYLDGEVAS